MSADYVETSPPEKEKNFPGIIEYLKSTLQYRTAPYHILRYCTSQHCAFQYVTSPRNTFEYLTVPFNTLQSLPMPYNTSLQYLAVPYNALQDCPVLNRTLQYRTLPLRPDLGQPYLTLPYLSSIELTLNFLNPSPEVSPACTSICLSFGKQKHILKSTIQAGDTICEA